MQYSVVLALLAASTAGVARAGGPIAVTNTIEYNGFEYGTQLNTDPSLSGTLCSSYLNDVDEAGGWAVASNGPDIPVVAEFLWETDFLVVYDGSTYHTGPHVGDRLYKGPDDDCGPRTYGPPWVGSPVNPRTGCMDRPWHCEDLTPENCIFYAAAFCNAVVLVSRPLPPGPDVCSPEDRDECSPYATCDKSNGTVTCTCRPGFTGDGATCEDVQECQDETYFSRCHQLAYCDETPGSFVCSCPEGFLGDGLDCANNAFGVRTVLDIPGVGSYSALQLEALRAAYAMLLLQDPALPANASVITTMPASFGATRFGQRLFDVLPAAADTDNQITLTVLFHSESEAQSVVDSLDSPDWAALGATGVSESPSVYHWVGGSTDDAVQVGPTGLSVDSVHFETSCMASGCWVVEVTYTAGNDDFNVFYLPNAAASDALSYDPDYTRDDATWPKSPADTFFPSSHPCTSMAYDPSSGSLPATVTACCIPEFLGMYRPVSAFESALDQIADLSFAGCGVGATDRAVSRATLPSFTSRGQAPNASHNTFPTPAAPGVLGSGIFVDGVFKGMNLSRIDHKAVADSFVGIFKATLRLDEVELRTLAGQLRGTVGVEHTVDTFVGLANFGPTGVQVLDTGAVQVNIHLEKTSFFSVSTHGTNDYTFLEYVNLRLVAIYNEDADFSGSSESADRTVRTDQNDAAHYVQVTFTMASKYAVNENQGLIPLDSVRAGSGQFFDEASMEHKCSQWTTASFPRIDDFNSTLQQPCSPAAAMCDSPAAVTDSFVSFNVPLGVDFFGEPSTALDNVVFAEMVISAVDTEARAAMTAPNDGEEPWQMKTTLTASIPVVEGGVNIFCDGFTAKTDLKDVANADIVVGSAANAAELTRLRILEDVASTQLGAEGPAEINTDSIESGLMTLVLKGNASYFDLPGNGEVSMELEDVISVHVMEDDGDGSDGATAAEVLRMIRAAPSDNSNAGGLDTDGYLLNEAVSFTVDRRSQRAHLEPTADLLARCPWSPVRQPGNVPLVTCVTRRDVQHRGYPKRMGGVSTAMEICPATDPHTDPCDDDHPGGCCGALSYSPPAADSAESQFMATLLGASDYAHQLAVDFAQTVDQRYQLNGRYRRAYWINPGYEWTPTQTGGGALFALSQKLFVVALITLDENIATSAGNLGPAPSFTARRMLLQSQAIDPLQAQQPGAAAGQTAVSYAVTPASMMANAFGVPEDRVASFTVGVQLTPSEACLPLPELQAKLRDTVDDYLSSTASAYQTVQIVSMTVDRGEEQCGGRRSLRRMLASAFSTATAELRMMIVFSAFADGSDLPRFNLARFATMPGINAVEAVRAASVQIAADESEADKAGWVFSSPQAAASDSEGSDSTALLAGVAGGVGALVVALVVGVILWRRRTPAQAPIQAAVQTVSLQQLKGELSLATDTRAEELRRELASEV